MTQARAFFDEQRVEMPPSDPAWHDQRGNLSRRGIFPQARTSANEYARHETREPRVTRLLMTTMNALAGTGSAWLRSLQTAVVKDVPYLAWFIILDGEFIFRLGQKSFD